MRRRLSNDEEAKLATRMEVSLNNANHFEAGLLASMALLINEVSCLRQEVAAVAVAIERVARFK